MHQPAFFVQRNDWLLVEIKQKVQKLHAFEVEKKTKKVENLRWQGLLWTLMQTKQAVDCKDYVKLKKRDILQKREFGWETAIHKILNNLSNIFSCDYRNMNTLRTRSVKF